jgi:hypothetical protein
MGWYVLKLPLQFYQDTDSHCWAAGAASWLRTTHIGNATPDVLVRRYAEYCNDQGYLVEDAASDEMSVVKAGGIVEVFRLIGCALTRIPREKFGFDIANTILRKKGHFLLVASRKDTDVVGHTRVVYGVGVPNDDSFSAFNPYRNETERPQGYENLPFTDFNTGPGNIYLGWAGWAGPDLGMDNN